MHKVFLLFVSVFFITSATLFGQQSLQREALINLSEEKSKLFAQQRKEAHLIADSLGLPIRQTFDDGVIIELQRFEHGTPIYYITHNAGGAATIGSGNVWPGGSSGLNLTGQGEIVGMWDGGATYVNHPEFQGRVIQMDDATTISDHATHVGGTMVAAGMNENARGMAYEASLHAYDWNNDAAQMAEAAANGLQVSQHSYGSITGWRYNYRNDGRWAWFGDPLISASEDYRFGFYNERAQLWDSIAYLAPNYLIVKSAGNDRGNGPSSQPVEHWVRLAGFWVLSSQVRDKDGGSNGFDCISTNGTAKNILTVGAVHGIPAGYSSPQGVAMSSFSSWGPTDDGRIKPDLVAKGVSVYSTSYIGGTGTYSSKNGTSMSGPMVSGSVGLMMQHHRNLHGNQPMLASTVKALLIHSANEAGPDPGPDYMFGWGLMDTQRAVSIMSENAEAGLHIKELSLGQDQQIVIPVWASGTEPLRATIAWTDVPGNPPPPSSNPGNIMLVNDLDIRILDANDNNYKPYILDPANPSNPATTGDNFRDNVEMIHIENPEPGKKYFVTISHKGNLLTGQQTFSLVITGNTQDNDPVSFSANPLDYSSISLSWEPNFNNDPVMIIYSNDGNFAVPQNGFSYSVGDTLDDGGTVLFQGQGNSFIHTGLQSYTRYHYKIFSVSSNLQYSFGLQESSTTSCVPIAQLPFLESFDTAGQIPECWRVVDYNNNNQVWDIGVIPFGLPGSQENYAFIYSQEFGDSGSQNSGLISPGFDLSGYSTVTLSFRHYFRQFGESSIGLLLYSTDRGENWTNIKEWNSNTQNPEDFSISLPQLSGDSLVMFQWLYEGADSHYWLVDDIQLTGETGAYADFGANEIKVFENQTLIFTDASGGANINQWQWDFGDNAVSETTQGPGPHHVFYTDSGPKTVSLTVNGNQTLTRQDYLWVYPLDFQAPSILEANVTNTDVSLNWDRPGHPKWVHWDSGTNASKVGNNGPVSFDVAQRYTPEQLLEKGLAGRYLTSVAWVPGVQNAEYTIKVWLGGNWDERNAGNLVSIQAGHNIVENQWNIVELNSPVFVDGNKELWIGYQVLTAQGNPAGIDQGKAVKDYGNLIYWNGTWTTLEAFNIDRNFNIHGLFGPVCINNGSNVNTLSFPGSEDNISALTDPFIEEVSDQGYESRAIAYHLWENPLFPDISGYRLFRNGESVALINQPWFTSYKDYDLAEGIYHYNVEVIYDNPSGMSQWSQTAVAQVDGSEPLYSLTLKAWPREGGMVEDLTSEGPYEAGMEILVRATPNEGFLFSEWVGMHVQENTQAEFLFLMPQSNVELTAFFQSAVYVDDHAEQGVLVYPNPSGGVFYLQSDSPVIRIKVNDISGKVMLDQPVNSNNYSFSASSWIPGVYFLQIVTTNDASTHKIILMGK